jgi:hypothetical protein
MTWRCLCGHTNWQHHLNCARCGNDRPAPKPEPPKPIEELSRIAVNHYPIDAKKWAEMFLKSLHACPK